MLGVIMLGVVMLGVVTLNVEAPKKRKVIEMRWLIVLSTSL